MTETTTPRLREAYRDERCWLMASQPGRTEADVLDDLDGMLRYCRRLRLVPILITDPRGVLADDPEGERLAVALQDRYGEYRASGLLMGWKIRPVRRIRWKVSVGWGSSVWLRGAAFTGHPYQAKITSREALMRWLPSGVILDPCAGHGELIVPGYRAGRRVVAVTDQPPDRAVAGLGQGMLFDPGAETPPDECHRCAVEATISPRGGWTRAGLESAGIVWPPPRGWRKALHHTCGLAD